MQKLMHVNTYIHTYIHTTTRIKPRYCSPSYQLTLIATCLPTNTSRYLSLSNIHMYICIQTHVNSVYLPTYEGVSINNQPIPFPMDREGHYFHALFQYMYTWVQNCTRMESFFNKILNVKHG